MRLFIAIKLSIEQLNEVKNVQKEFDTLIHGSKSSDFHLTLKFLGEIDEKLLPNIIDALNKVKIDEINLILSNIGVFPGNNNPRVLWVGLNNDDNLAALEKNISNALSFLNLKEDHKFHPHITLYRIKEIKDKQKFLSKLKNTDVKKIASKTSGFTLYKSTLTPNGPIYDVVKEFFCD